MVGHQCNGVCMDRSQQSHPGLECLAATPQGSYHKGGSGYLTYNCPHIYHESTHPLTCIGTGGVPDASVVTPIVGETERRGSGPML